MQQTELALISLLIEPLRGQLLPCPPSGLFNGNVNIETQKLKMQAGMLSRPLAGLPLVFSALMLVSAQGCGGGEAVHEVEVTGKITIDGEPIDQGSISFVAADGVARTGGGVIKDGKYIARVAPGEKKVMVLGNKVVGTEPLYKGVPDSPTREKLETVTPPAYNAAHQTPLTATITDQPQSIDFELSKSLK